MIRGMKNINHNMRMDNQMERGMANVIYYRTIQLCVICSYIDGKINGEYKSCYENGELIEK